MSNSDLPTMPVTSLTLESSTSDQSGEGSKHHPSKELLADHGFTYDKTTAEDRKGKAKTDSEDEENDTHVPQLVRSDDRPSWRSRQVRPLYKGEFRSHAYILGNFVPHRLPGDNMILVDQLSQRIPIPPDIDLSRRPEATEIEWVTQYSRLDRSAYFPISGRTPIWVRAINGEPVGFDMDESLAEEICTKAGIWNRAFL